MGLQCYALPSHGVTIFMILLLLHRHSTYFGPFAKVACIAAKLLFHGPKGPMGPGSFAKEKLKNMNPEPQCYATQSNALLSLAMHCVALQSCAAAAPLD